jgi:hypothetical protein
MENRENIVMPKTNPTREQSSVLPSTSTENCDATLEMFADQLANLLWQQWKYSKEKQTKQSDPKQPEQA